MVQEDKYKKVCHLSDSETALISDFFEKMFDVKKITNIKIYVANNYDREARAICEIEGFEGFEEKPTRAVGSLIAHDLRK